MITMEKGRKGAPALKWARAHPEARPAEIRRAMAAQGIELTLQSCSRIYYEVHPERELVKA